MFVGQIINCKIEKIFPTYLLVKTEESYDGLLHIANISDYYVWNINSIFKIGEKYNFEIIEINEEKKWIKLSWKSISPRFQKNPFNYIIKETSNGFKNLKKKVECEEKND